MTAITPSTSIQHAETKANHPFDPTRVQYSLRWVGAGATLTALAAVATRWGGLPVAAMLGAIGIAGAAYSTLLEPRRPVLERITLRLPTLPPALEGLRIGQLSDLHLGHPFTETNTRWAVQQMLREQPDLLLITGDFVSFDHAIDQLPELLAPLHAPLGIYAVPGNHDYWEGVDTIRAQLAPLGIEFLINSHRLLHWQGGSFVLAGIDDLWDGKPDLDAALAGVAPESFTMLLSHAPDSAPEVAQRNIAVQFSGHTHGGHLRLPLLGSFCLPLYGTRYAIGHEQVGALQLYVSRGLGGVPLRLGCPPEATIFTLARQV